MNSRLQPILDSDNQPGVPRHYGRASLPPAGLVWVVCAYPGYAALFPRRSVLGMRWGAPLDPSCSDS